MKRNGGVYKKKRGNPAWLRPKPQDLAHPTQFEIEARHIAPDRWVNSWKLRLWAARNRNSRYVPENLLSAWGLTVTDLWMWE